jgi:iron-sulfur cluster repair protein YtfE (RIC family)
MTQLYPSRSQSNFAMPGTRSRSNVQIRADRGGIGHVPWPTVADAELTKRQLAPSLPAKHVVGRTNRAAGGWRKTHLADLCSYFEHDNHVQLRYQLAQITGIVATSVAKYGDSQEHVREINTIFFELRERLWTHIFREEHGLYSSIVNIERNWIRPYCRSSVILRAIRVMRREHRYFRKSFRRIAELLSNYEIPTNSGQSYANLVHGFQRLESLNLKHMQK